MNLIRLQPQKALNPRKLSQFLSLFSTKKLKNPLNLSHLWSLLKSFDISLTKWILADTKKSLNKHFLAEKQIKKLSECFAPNDVTPEPPRQAACLFCHTKSLYSRQRHYNHLPRNLKINKSHGNREVKLYWDSKVFLFLLLFYFRLYLSLSAHASLLLTPASCASACSERRSECRGISLYQNKEARETFHTVDDDGALFAFPATMRRSENRQKCFIRFCAFLRFLVPYTVSIAEKRKRKEKLFVLSFFFCLAFSLLPPIHPQPKTNKRRWRWASELLTPERKFRH